MPLHIGSLKAKRPVKPFGAERKTVRDLTLGLLVERVEVFTGSKKLQVRLR